jgi:hypothetical protein
MNSNTITSAATSKSEYFTIFSDLEFSILNRNMDGDVKVKKLVNDINEQEATT